RAGDQHALVLEPAHGRSALVALDRVADQPEHRGPQPDEHGAALGVPARGLVDRLGADPQPEAERDEAQRRDVQVPPAKAELVEALAEHLRLLPRVWDRELGVGGAAMPRGPGPLQRLGSVAAT